MSYSQRALDLYYALNTLYASPHPDRVEDVERSCERLDRAFLNGQDEISLIGKMQEYLRSQSTSGGQFKSKTSSMIVDRFWLKDYTRPIPYTRFKPDEPED